ncbi:MAG TPA: hypothetical protein VFE32_01890 [Puia sp.]|jgi:hypothetical protein|nr:hypothetical protein [Puia sp.]
MKKSAFFSIALVVISFFSAVRVHAQAFEAGTNVVSAGIGLGSSLASGYTYGTQTPGFSAGYERGIWEAGPGVISLGAYVGFKGFKYGYVDAGYAVTEKWNYSIFGVRGAYHFTGLNVENLDLYAGVMIAYDNLSFSYSDNAGNSYAGNIGSYNSGLGVSIFAGARYYFAGNLGVFGELGYGVSILGVGLSYKF